MRVCLWGFFGNECEIKLFLLLHIVKAPDG